MKKTLALSLVATLCSAPSASADTTDGSCMEEFTLQNFQPRSATYGHTVLSRSYTSRVTVFSLLASS